MHGSIGQSYPKSQSHKIPSQTEGISPHNHICELQLCALMDFFKLGPGSHPCHSILNDKFYRALIWTSIPSVKELPGPLRSDGKIPDSMTMIPSQAGHCLVWDVTGADTVTANNLPFTLLTAWANAKTADARKSSNTLICQPFIWMTFETLGLIIHFPIFPKTPGRAFAFNNNPQRYTFNVTHSTEPKFPPVIWT